MDLERHHDESRNQVSGTTRDTTKILKDNQVKANEQSFGLSKISEDDECSDCNVSVQSVEDDEMERFSKLN